MTTLNSTSRRLVIAAAVVAATALVATPALATPALSAALVDDEGNAFVRNSFVQAGAKPNGSFGAESPVAGAPASAGFIASSEQAGLLGLMNDPGRDGFGVGVDHGDFFLPGSPYEAWGIFAAGELLGNSDSDTEIVGAFQPVAGGVTNAVTWATTDPANGIGIEQTYTAPDDNQHLIRIDVTLTNTTGDAQTVYYVRQVDPDNSVDNIERDGADWDGYSTFNSVLAQNGSSQLVVGYSYYDSSIIGFQAADPNAIVRISDWSLPLSEESVTDATTAAAAFESYRALSKTGFRDYEDSTIDIIVKREIAAGATASLTFDYVLDPRALSTPHPEYALDLNLEMEIGGSYADVPAYLAGGGLKPNSDYTLTEFSTPRVIFTGTTLANGLFYDETALPTDCRPGSHTLVLTGTAPDGTKVSDWVSYTVDADCVVTAFDPFAAANGAPNPQATAPELAETGADITLFGALTGLAFVLVALGAATLVRTRRASASAG